MRRTGQSAKNSELVTNGRIRVQTENVVPVLEGTASNAVAQDQVFGLNVVSKRPGCTAENTNIHLYQKY